MIYSFLLKSQCTLGIGVSGFAPPLLVYGGRVFPSAAVPSLTQHGLSEGNQLF